MTDLTELNLHEKRKNTSGIISIDRLLLFEGAVGPDSKIALSSLNHRKTPVVT